MSGGFMDDGPGGGRSAGAVLRDLRRVTPGPLLLRGIAFGAGVTAIAIALPAELTTPVIMSAGALLALLSALAPRGGMVTLTQVCVVVVWFVGTAMGAVPVTTPVLIGLACAMYTHHAACALAAAVPLDSMILPSVLARWLGRTFRVILITIIFGVVVVTLPEWLSVRPALMFPLFGMAGVILISVLLAHLALRTPRRGG